MTIPLSDPNANARLIGPFAQLVTLEDLPLKGSLGDQQLVLRKAAGIRVKGSEIVEIGPFERMAREAGRDKIEIAELPAGSVGVPGFIDAHTHSCFAGTRARDYALRNSGSSYLEIAKAGGGIWDSVQQTRKASPGELEALLLKRIHRFLNSGITTLEVKSGYGLSVSEELKMLRVIRSASEKTEMDLVSTCLAAHTCPKDFQGSAVEYLQLLEAELLPVLVKEGLTSRLDAFVEQSAFTPHEILPYLKKGKPWGSTSPSTRTNLRPVVVLWPLLVGPERRPPGSQRTCRNPGPGQKRSNRHRPARGESGIGVWFYPFPCTIGCRGLPGHCQRLQSRVGAHG